MYMYYDVAQLDAWVPISALVNEQYTMECGRRTHPELNVISRNAAYWHLLKLCCKYFQSLPLPAPAPPTHVYHTHSPSPPPPLPLMCTHCIYMYSVYVDREMVKRDLP